MEINFNFILACFSLIKTVSSSYILYADNVDFSDAVQKCDTINATVVLPKNKTEDDFILNNFLNNASVTSGIWLAIYDIDISGSENNVNYYTNETLLYTNWFTREPGNKFEYCTTYLKTSQWHDYPCSSKFSVLCEVTEYSKSSCTLTSSTMTTASTSSTANTKTDTIIKIIALWNTWNPWSFCEFHRQRNNNKMGNGIENEIINVSCSLVCAYSVLI